MDFDFKEYFRELQRRHVVKAGLAYLVGAWLLVQVLDILLDAFELGPGWMQTTIIALSIGFPIWLIIAWVYDFSPEGIKKTEDVPFDPEASANKNLQLNRFIIGGLSIVVILLVVNTFRMSDEFKEIQEDVLSADFKSSIAVLALEDRSPNKDHEYLSFGISENIYDRLIKFKDLKVTSPTSSFFYKDKDISFDVIAEELGVAYILEGSIVPIADKYRISMRLIDSKDNSAIWSKTYDDKKENILKTYDDLARNIARYLKLTVDETDIQQRKVDPEAYDLWLRAWDLSMRSRFNEDAMRQADSMLTRALSIDSTYSRIHSGYAGTLFHRAVYLGAIDRDSGLQRAMRSAKRAYELDPEDISAINWCSNLSWHLRDVENYQKYLNELEGPGQGNADAMFYISWCYRRMNQVDKGYPYAKKAVELNPKNVDNLNQLMDYEVYYGNLEKARSLIDIIGDIYPESDEWYTDSLIWYYFEKEDFSKAEELIHTLEKDNQLVYKIYLEGYRGNLDYVIDNYESSDPGDWSYNMACFHAVNGLIDEAFEFLDGAFEEVCDYPELFFMDPDLKTLDDDPRWDAFINRLSEEFNYDFPHRPE